MCFPGLQPPAHHSQSHFIHSALARRQVTCLQFKHCNPSEVEASRTFLCFPLSVPQPSQDSPRGSRTLSQEPTGDLQSPMCRPAGLLDEALGCLAAKTGKGPVCQVVPASPQPCRDLAAFHQSLHSLHQPQIFYEWVFNKHIQIIDENIDFFKPPVTTHDEEHRFSDSSP